MIYYIIKCGEVYYNYISEDGVLCTWRNKINSERIKTKEEAFRIMGLIKKYMNVSIELVTVTVTELVVDEDI